MGKNKGAASKGKKPNVFKVAGARSLKAKAKAKTVTVQLKKINNAVRKNVREIDAQLVALQKDIVVKKEVARKVEAPAPQPRAPVSEQDKSDTVLKLAGMQF